MNSAPAQLSSVLKKIGRRQKPSWRIMLVDKARHLRAAPRRQ